MCERIWTLPQPRGSARLPRVRGTPQMQEFRILNLGCGTKTSPDCINIDWSPHLRLARNSLLYSLSQRILSGERLKHLEQLRSSVLNGAVLAHDLRKGIPFSDSSFDAVYH